MLWTSAPALPHSGRLVLGTEWLNGARLTNFFDTRGVKSPRDGKITGLPWEDLVQLNAPLMPCSGGSSSSIRAGVSCSGTGVGGWPHRLRCPSPERAILRGSVCRKCVGRTAPTLLDHGFQDIGKRSHWTSDV